jgi:hypothetical protein
MLIKDKNIHTIDFFKTLESKESQDEFIHSMQPCPTCGHTLIHHMEQRDPPRRIPGPCLHMVFGSIPGYGSNPGVTTKRVRELYEKGTAALSAVRTCACRYLVDEFDDD